MFRKPKSKALRQRAGYDADADGADTTTSASTTSDAVSKSEPSTLRQSTIKTALSFNQEDGDDVADFKIRRKVPASLSSPPLQARGKEKRKKKEHSGASDLGDHNGRGRRIGGEGSGDLTESTSVNVPASDRGVAKTCAMPQRPKFEPNEQGGEGTGQLPASSMQRTDTAPTSTEIPDAKAIYEARKRREKMRLGGGEEFIPVDDTVRLKDVNSAATSASGQRHRLIREDENDVSDEDDLDVQGARFYSAKSLLTTREEEKRNQEAEFLRIEQGDDSGDEQAGSESRDVDSDDDELARWERDQIRKGVSMQRVTQLQDELHATSLHYAGNGSEWAAGESNVITLNEDDNMEVDMDVEVVESSVPAVAAKPNFTPAASTSVASIAERIQCRLMEKREQLNGSEYEQERVTNNLAENETTIGQLRGGYPHLQDKYRLFQDMRLYCRDLLECLNTKITDIDELENEVSAMWRRRSERLSKRRKQDVQDEYEKCAVLSMGRQWVAPSPDYFMREAEREARRSRRRMGRTRNTLAASRAPHHEGLSSDDEETTSQQVIYADTTASLKARAANVFDGVLEEFCSVGKIVNRFIDWLAVDERSFREAYIALCLPKLLSPFVRLEMIGWMPHQTCEELMANSWYRELLCVGMDNAGVDVESSAEITDLIPCVVEKVLLPILARIVREQWDPLSLRESTNLANNLRLIADYPTLNAASKRTREVLEAIQKRFKQTIADETFIPLYSRECIESTATGCGAFLDRQFWKTLKLIRSILCFRCVLSHSCIEELVVEDIINRATVMALQVSVITSPAIVQKCVAVAAEIPTDWQQLSSRPVSYRPLANFFKQVLDVHSEADRELLTTLRKFVESTAANVLVAVEDNNGRDMQ